MWKFFSLILFLLPQNKSRNFETTIWELQTFSVQASLPPLFSIADFLFIYFFFYLFHAVGKQRR